MQRLSNVLKDFPGKACDDKMLGE